MVFHQTGILKLRLQQPRCFQKLPCKVEGLRGTNENVRTCLTVLAGLSWEIPRLNLGN